MYLLDTHTLLWFLHDSPQLSKKALNIITTEQYIYVSSASLWEIAIKRVSENLTLNIRFNK